MATGYISTTGRPAYVGTTGCDGEIGRASLGNSDFADLALRKRVNAIGAYPEERVGYILRHLIC